MTDTPTGRTFEIDGLTIVEVEVAPTPSPHAPVTQTFATIDEIEPLVWWRTGMTEYREAMAALHDGGSHVGSFGGGWSAEATPTGYVFREGPR